MKELENIDSLPGMLTSTEVECLFKLGQFDQAQGVIVEIGSWKGKSTAALALGAARTHKQLVYAIDPHTILPEEGYLKPPEPSF